MPRASAGILLYRLNNTKPEVLLVHPGGPFWKNKDEGAWSIPKGEVKEGEELLTTARREFEEEIGVAVNGNFKSLAPIKQKSGKIVHAFAVHGEIDTSTVKSNTCFIDWPPRSGKQIEIPEIDRAEFFDIATARKKINPAQAALLEELMRTLGRNAP